LPLDPLLALEAMMLARVKALRVMKRCRASMAPRMLAQCTGWMSIAA
jgi:hypothetical protein